MAAFVHVGNRWVNIENINLFEDKANEDRLYLTMNGGEYLSFDGDDRGTLLAMLNTYLTHRQGVTLMTQFLSPPQIPTLPPEPMRMVAFYAMQQRAAEEELSTHVARCRLCRIGCLCLHKRRVAHEIKTYSDEVEFWSRLEA